MLLDNYVVTDGEPKPGSFSGRFRCEERVEHLFFHFRCHTGPVVANPDFHAIAKAFGRGSEGWYVIASVGFRLALGRRIEAVCNQIQKSPRDVLRKDVDFTSRWIKGLFERDFKALFLGPRPVPCEIEAFLNESIDIDRSVLA